MFENMILEIRKLLTKRNGYFLIIFILAAVIGFDYNILHGFFPYIAPTKNFTIFHTGLLYSEYELINLIVFPLAGKLAPIIGGEKVLFLGAFVCGVSSILFGLAYFFDAGLPFLLFSFLFRGIGAVGAAACYVVNPAMIATLGDRDKVCTLIGTLESVMAGGILIGPFVGSILFKFGGYLCPFLVSGILMLIISLVTISTFPSFKCTVITDRKYSYFLTSINFWMNILALFVISFNEGFQSACFFIYCKDTFQMTPVMSSLAFLSDPLAFVIFSPLVGLLNDAYPSFAPISISLGLFVESLSMCFMGPLPFLGIKPHIAYCVGSSIFNGIGYAFVFSPVFVQLFKVAVKAGLSDDFQTYSTISSFHLFFSISGLALGPAIGVTLYDFIGYGYACGSFALLMAVEGLLLFTVFLISQIFQIDIDDLCKSRSDSVSNARKMSLCVDNRNADNELLTNYNGMVLQCLTVTSSPDESLKDKEKRKV